MVEQEGDGVAQDLPEQPARQVPQIARPHPLYGVPPHEFRYTSQSTKRPELRFRALLTGKDTELEFTRI